METAAVEKVLGKVLEKLEAFVDTVEPEKLSPQSMKHVTATLKDIRDLTDTAQTDGIVYVEFDHPEWKA